MLRDVLDVFLPRCCAGCGRPGAGWCAACADRLAAELAEGASVRVVDRGDLPPVSVLATYAGATRAALLAYKERGRRDLVAVLAPLLAVGIRDVGHRAPAVTRPLIVVGIPASAGAVRRRGVDHLAELVRAAPGVPGPSPLLHWCRRVSDQATLDASGRVANLAGALRVRPRWTEGPGRPGVVLVDDVVTTGATLREAVRACRAAGFPVVGAVAVAGTAAPGAEAEGQR